MKRRQFIKNSALLSTLAVIAPAQIFSLDKRFNVIDIKPVKPHVRHGQFNLQQTTNSQIDEHILQLERNMFLRNGHTMDSESDPYLISIKTVKTDASVLLKEGEISRQLGDMNIELINHSKEIDTKALSYLIPIKNKVRTNLTTITRDQMIRLDAGIKLRIKKGDSCLLLRLT